MLSTNWCMGRQVLLLMAAGGRPCSSAAPRTPSAPGSKYPFLAKQSLGQNFLVDDNLARAIVASVRDAGVGGSGVVELGPGQGALTKHAIERWPHMTAIELDRRAIALLGTKMPMLKTAHCDMLKVDWAEVARGVEGGERLSVITNPPYHLTAELLLKLVLNAEHIGSVVITLQKEAVERLLSPPGCKSYTALGVLYAIFAETEVLFDLPPEAFSPAPKVTSTCIRVRFSGEKLGLEYVAGVHKIAKVAFMERRKMLRQALKGVLAAEPPLGGAGGALPERFAALRAEQLKPLHFAELAEALGYISVSGGCEPDATVDVSV
ncbi:S-adenosyl-L-methionine-dependent methyltransferase [Pavlovales sp. CCMP2436]|nr:S-adenosyl-L-methionine-dependent methyltransferase [Pavlovales sp. CCMP2436]